MSTDEQDKAVREFKGPHIHVFPQWVEDGSCERMSRGLTKRELFAAMAMQGLLANFEVSRGMAEKHKGNPAAGRAELAEGCVMMSDALLAALEASK